MRNTEALKGVPEKCQHMHYKTTEVVAYRPHFQKRTYNVFLFAEDKKEVRNYSN